MEWSCAAESVPGKVCQGRRPTEGKCPAARSDWGEREREREKEGKGGEESEEGLLGRPTDRPRPGPSLISSCLSVHHSNKECLSLGRS